MMHLLQVCRQSSKILARERFCTVFAKDSSGVYCVGRIKINKIPHACVPQRCSKVPASKLCTLELLGCRNELGPSNELARTRVRKRDIEFTFCIRSVDAIEAITVQKDKPYCSLET